MKRTFLTFLLIAAATMMLTVGISGAQDDTLKIGVLTDLSGALSVYGIEMQNGVTLGFEYATGGTMTIAGRPVELIFRDDGSDPDTALEQARDLITQEGVEVLMGTVSSGATLGLQQVAADFDVVLMTGPAAAPQITGSNFNDHTFRVCRNTYQDFLTIAPYAQDIVGGNRFVQFAADYAFGTGSAAAAEYALGQYGIEFVRDTILVPLDATDFTPYLQEALDTDANGLIIIWAGSTTINLLQQVGEMGVADRMTVLQAYNSNDLMPFLVPENFVGQLGWMIYHYTLPDNDVNDWLVEQHRDAYDGDVPDLFTECTFASAQAVVAGISATGGDTSPAALIPALEGLAFDGPKGHYFIRAQDHQAMVPMFMVRLVNLTDPDFKYYELVATAQAYDIIPPCEAPERCEGYDLDEARTNLQALFEGMDTGG